VVLPVAVSAALSIRLGLGCRWGVGCYSDLVTCAPALTSLYIALCDGGSPTMEQLDASDQGVAVSSTWSCDVVTTSPRP
jgi:hypothetical protein